MAELDEVLRILKCRTHYEVLKLAIPHHTPVFIDVQQVRKRYKELAILVHPDKNRATDAESAFKRLSEAYECLADEVSQRNYLQQLQLKFEPKWSRQKSKYKRKRKQSSKSATEDKTKLPKRLRTPEEIWQEFRREEEELARQHFQAKGFDRLYEPTVKQPGQVAGDASVPTEEQYTVLNFDLDAKAYNWAKWNKPALKKLRTESALESGATSTPRIVPTNLICCMVCRRKFISAEALQRHEALSEMHLANVQAQQG